MSFIVTGEDAPEGPQNIFQLKAERIIRVPPVSRAVVPHGISIAFLDPLTVVLLLRKPWAWAEMNLLIDVGEINPADPICTRVFNLSSKEVTIRRGMIISHLVSLRVSAL